MAGGGGGFGGGWVGVSSTLPYLCCEEQSELFAHPHHRLSVRRRATCHPTGWRMATWNQTGRRRVSLEGLGGLVLRIERVRLSNVDNNDLVLCDG